MEEILEIMRENSKKLSDPVQIKILREMIEPAFKAMLEHSERMYNELEEKIFQSIGEKEKKYTIYTTLLKKDELNYNGLYLQPIIQKDVEERDFSEILKNIKNGESEILEKIYLELEYKEIKEIVEREHEFTAFICSGENKCKIKVILEFCEEYIEKEEEIYRLFYANNIKWNSINNPYIRKMVNIRVLKVAGDISEIDEITEIEYEFEDLNEKYNRGYIPAWNIFEKPQNITSGIEPAEDNINYCYTIFTEEIKEESGGILVRSDIGNIKSTKRLENGGLKIISDTEGITVWQMYFFKDLEKYTSEGNSYNIFSNWKDSIFDRVKLKCNTVIKSRNEIKRITDNLGKKYGIKLLEINEESEEREYEKESYAINSYIKDEIRTRKIDKKLILKFEVEKYNYMTVDILSYIVGEVENDFSDYRCIGVIE